METLAKSQGLPLEQRKQAALINKIETLERRTRELDESIRYAGMLQQSILPNGLIFKNNFKDAFVYYQPKDVIGGDFYWIYLHG
ncbi:MAG: serine/threonine protein kinase, partial [Crocinitomicaceae bacterium]|nr:serine/threonine protein kinase [Crocinitomicaceae bacterium]